MLGPAVAGAQVLDAYAGAGTLGLEACSRGADHVVLVEPHRQVRQILTENVARLQSSAEIWPLTAAAAFRRAQSESRRFDLVFLDPPYAANLWNANLEALVIKELLFPEAIVVCEHPGRQDAPTGPMPLTYQETRRFGDVALSLFLLPSLP